MNAMASQIISLMIVYSAVCSDADQRKYRSSTSLAFVRGIHRSPVNSPHKGLVTRKLFSFDDVLMTWARPLTNIAPHAVGVRFPVLTSWLSQTVGLGIRAWFVAGKHAESSLVQINLSWNIEIKYEYSKIISVVYRWYFASYMIQTKRTAFLQNSVYKLWLWTTYLYYIIHDQKNIRKAFVNVNMYIFELATSDNLFSQNYFLNAFY